MYLTIIVFFICGFFTKSQEAKDIIYKTFTINKMEGTEAISHLIIKDSKGKSIKHLANMRDNFLIDLLKLKNKYRIK